MLFLMMDPLFKTSWLIHLFDPKYPKLNPAFSGRICGKSLKYVRFKKSKTLVQYFHKFKACLIFD